MAKAITINISMPQKLGDFVRERMRQKGFDNTSEYFRRLVREDQARAEQERVEALLLEGLASGPPEEVDEQWWAQRRAELARRVKERDTGRA